MKMDGLILAGGKSTRMGGKHKGDLLYRDVAFTERIVRQFRKGGGPIWLSYGEIPGKTYEGCTVIRDIYPGCGPVGGIYTGLERCKSDAVMAAACDMPLIEIGLFRYLERKLAEEEERRGLSYAAAVPVVGGRVHPLAAIYKVEMKDVLKEQILAGNYRIRDALRRKEVLYVDVTDEKMYRDMLRNVNTAEEYGKLLEGEGDEEEMNRLTLDEARKILLDQVQRIEETEEISLWDAAGRILAEDVTAVRNQPPFPRSPLDGYAARGADLEGASKEHPAVLTVIDEVTAGHVTRKQVGERMAVRIMTGAPIPDGADCVVGQEDTDYGEETVEVYEEIRAGQNYCLEGEDYKKGTRLLSAGTLLGAVEVGTIASLGKETVKVYRSPRAALITTGDEIVLPGEELKEGQIYDSNLYTLGSRLIDWRIPLTARERAGDDAEDVAGRVRKAAKEADIIITTGGVSVGKKDIMHDVLKILGCERLFWGIAIKPGMPTLCASYQGKLLICLSGNPYGAVVNLELLVRPVLAKMSGRSGLELKRIQAVTKSGFPKKSFVTRYIRAYQENGEVWMADGRANSSGILSSMCGCNCLVEIPAGTQKVQEGETVCAILL